MKKLLLVFVLLLAAFAACAQTTLFLKDGTLAWDQPLDENGEAIPAAELTYEVYASFWPVTDPQNPEAHTLLATVSVAELPVTVSIRRIAFGVRAIRTNDGDSVVSEMAWSYIEGDADPAVGPWIARWLPRPWRPGRFRIW